MIYISTGGVKNKTAFSFSEELASHGIMEIELSGGIYSESLLDDLLNLSSKINFQIHNYFPPPKKPFVLNLGSLDVEVGMKSYEHVKRALEWCSKLGSDHYSFHAGFLCDLKVNELGKKIHSKSTNLDTLHEIVIKNNLEPKEKSGQQEMLENIINKYL